MFNRSSRAAAGAAFVLATALFVLPACDKKKEAGNHSGPPPDAGTQGSKGGPPPGYGSQGGTPKPAEAGMPSPPGAGPHLQLTPQSRASSVNNLRQIGLAFHNHHDVMNGLPHAIADSSGKPGLSWRVAILPYIGQDGLYKSFKLSEPWNSDHNKKLIASMPKIYAPPGVETNGYTYYRSFSGQGAVMPPSTQPGKPGQQYQGIRMTSVTDGLANTLMVAEANEPVIWTKPDDLPFAPGKPPKLGGAVFAEGFSAVLGDGSVRFIRSGGLDAKTLSNLIQINDGQIVTVPD